MTTAEKPLHKAKYYLWIGLSMWAVIGILAGTLLGVTLGLENRQIVLFAAIGLGIGWFGATGLLARSRRPSSVLPPQLPAHATVISAAPSAVIGPVTSVIQSLTPQKTEEVLSKEEARKWLDDFLVKQQDDTRD